MKNSFAVKTLLSGLAVFVFCGGVLAQPDVARKTVAITYPLDETVQVQFRGTTRFPRMKGSAKIKRTTRTGTQIELSVDNMPRPFELGAGYATYVLWAISPTGQADNLGEIKRSGLFFIDSKMKVTTNLQTFALIITAEPHFLVTRPSQSVMLENLNPVNQNGLVGTSPTITYFGNSSDYFRDPRTPGIAETDYANTPPAILQAIQAVALAKFAGAERDASTELAEAETLLQNAQNSFAAGRDSGADRGHQPVLELEVRTRLERRDHRGRHALGRQQITGRDRIEPVRDRVGAERAVPGVRAGAAGGVDRGQLPERDQPFVLDDGGDRLDGAESPRHTVEQPCAETRIGDVLGTRRSDPGAHKRAPRRHGRAGGRNHDAELPGMRAPASERQRHACGILSAGITAVTSISTSHSGRASAVTTRPVDTGWTPLSHLPTTR